MTAPKNMSLFFHHKLVNKVKMATGQACTRLTEIHLLAYFQLYPHRQGMRSLMIDDMLQSLHFEQHALTFSILQGMLPLEEPTEITKLT